MKKIGIIFIILLLLLVSCQRSEHNDYDHYIQRPDIEQSVVSVNSESFAIDVVESDHSLESNDSNIYSCESNTVKYYYGNCDDAYRLISGLFGDVITVEEVLPIIRIDKFTSIQIMYDEGSETGYVDWYDIGSASGGFFVYPNRVGDTPIWQETDEYRIAVDRYKYKVVMFESNEQSRLHAENRRKEGDNTPEIAFFHYVKEGIDVFIAAHPSNGMSYTIVFKIGSYVFSVHRPEYRYNELYTNENASYYAIKQGDEWNEAKAIAISESLNYLERDWDIFDYYTELADNSTESSYIVRLLKDVVANHK